MKILQIKLAFLDILRRLPHFRGKMRIAKRVLGRNRESIKNYNLNLKNGSTLVLPNLIEHSCFELFVNSVYEKASIELLNKYLPQGTTFIDIGANIGAISTQLAILRPDIHIIAVEASPIIFLYLVKNVEHNNINNISLYNVAINSESGVTLPFYSPVDKIGCGSFSPVFTKKAIDVSCITLDDLLIQSETRSNDIGIIKIDIEGHELLAFKGATEYLQAKNAKLFFEFVDWAEENAGYTVGAAQQVLFDLGFSLSITGKSTKRDILQSPMRKGVAMILAVK